MQDDIAKEVYIIGELFRQLYDKYSKMENKRHLYKDIKELTLIEINTIIVIGHDDKHKSMSQIANTLGVSFGTPTITIDRLIGKGYVERIRDEEDRRQVFVMLSQKGESVYKSVIALKNRVAEKVFGVLTPDERTVFIEAMSRINGKFEELFSVDP